MWLSFNTLTSVIIMMKYKSVCTCVCFIYISVCVWDCVCFIYKSLCVCVSVCVCVCVCVSVESLYKREHTELTTPCNPNPCNASQICEVSRHQKCSPASPPSSSSSPSSSNSSSTLQRHCPNFVCRPGWWECFHIYPTLLFLLTLDFSHFLRHGFFTIILMCFFFLVSLLQ